VVLLVEAVVHDLAAGAQLMGAGVDQRLVLHVLVRLAGHRVDRQQRAAQVVAALVDEVVGVQQELLDRLRDIVLDAVRPQRVVVRVALRQQRDHAVEEGPVRMRKAIFSRLVRCRLLRCRYSITWSSVPNCEM
jgi:hypothetical protein